MSDEQTLSIQTQSLSKRTFSKCSFRSASANRDSQDEHSTESKPFPQSKPASSSPLSPPSYSTSTIPQRSSSIPPQPPLPSPYNPAIKSKPSNNTHPQKPSADKIPQRNRYCSEKSPRQIRSGLFIDAAPALDCRRAEPVLV
jgi:hypothetical protein